MELYISDLHLGSSLFKSKHEVLNLVSQDFEKNSNRDRLI